MAIPQVERAKTLPFCSHRNCYAAASCAAAAGADARTLGTTCCSKMSSARSQSMAAPCVGASSTNVNEINSSTCRKEHV